jgi:uncharacterized protein GlcG (DUF336 family)
VKHQRIAAVTFTAIAILAAGSTFSVAQAQTQAVRTERNMSLDLANQLAAATVASCLAGGHNVTAAVVDRAGQLRALHRADNAGPHTILVHIPGFLLLGGGVPVKVGNEVIGAIGVGGAPGGHLDEQCAVAAIDKAKDLLK